MYGDESSKNRFEVNSQFWHGPKEQSFSSHTGRQTGFPNPNSYFYPRFHHSGRSHPSLSAYSQREVYSQPHRSNNSHMIFENKQSTQMKIPSAQQNDSTNSTAHFQAPEQMKSFHYLEKNSKHSEEHVTPICYQSQISPCFNLSYTDQSPPLQQNNVPHLNEDLMRHHTDRVNNLSLHLNRTSTQPSQMPQFPTVIDQADTDKVLVKQWLEQRQLQPSNVQKPQKTLKISEAQNLFQRYLHLNYEIKQEHDELAKNIGSESSKWNASLAEAEKTKDEIKFIETVINDSDTILDLQEKIHKRKRKRLWLKNRRRRRYVEKQEDEQRRKVLHQNIDQWQKEIREKDLAARKAASLKHEAGGVLGEVRRKLQDCHKLVELIKSLVKLRELRKSEGEKKGVYPKTSSTEDRNFKTRCEYVDSMVRKRVKNYEDEEKALRVIIMEEEGKREKKEKQQRLEQKSLLNLSREDDPLADYSRYYSQADEGIEFLIQIRREWDMYITPDINIGSRVPEEDITAAPPSSGLWASVLKVGE